MGKANKSARQELERLYGKECFIEKLKLREKYGEVKVYTGRNQVKKAVLKRQKQLTYHHILEKSKGGKATVENGAILSAENHVWFHQQPKERQKEMNEAFQEYKKNGLKINAVEMTIEGIKSYHQITFEEMGIGYEIIRLEDNAEEDKEFLDVTEGMSEEEIRKYEEYKKQRNERVKGKFGSEQVGGQVSEQVERPHAHIDEEWQKEILEDLEMEFNERNRGGYGR